MTSQSQKPSLFEAVDWEYGIFLLRDLSEPHRSGMTREEAEEWLAGWFSDGGSAKVFAIWRRPVGGWGVLADA